MLNMFLEHISQSLPPTNVANCKQGPDYMRGAGYVNGLARTAPAHFHGLPHKMSIAIHGSEPAR